MAQLPTRSLRLRSYATTDLDRLTGERGEIFYDYEKRTLKVYNGAGAAASTVNVGSLNSLVNGANSVSLDAQGILAVPSYITVNTANNIIIQARAGNDAVITSNSGSNRFYVNNTAAYVQSGNFTTWTFGTNGTLTAPGTVNAPSIFTSLIDSADSSAITITPSAVFSSNVTIENDLTLNTGTINSAEATWRLQGIDLTLPEYGSVTAKTAITLQADQVAGPDVAAASGLYAEVFALLYSYSDVVIRANNNGVYKDWTFGGNGTLTAPGTVNAPNIFTNLIDSADSSAITVTPAAVFSSDVTVENDLSVKGLLTLSQGTISGPNTVTIAGAGVAAAGANQTYIKTSATNYQGVTNSNWIITYVADPGLWAVADTVSEIAWFLSADLKLWQENGDANPPATPPTGTFSSINIENNGSQWRFEGEGRLILPSGVTVYSAKPYGINSVQTRIEAPAGDEIALISKGAWTYGDAGDGDRPGIFLAWYQNPTDNNTRYAAIRIDDFYENIAKVTITAAGPGEEVRLEKDWTFDQTGVLTFPDGGTLRVGTVPAHSYGVAGDKIGTLAFDATYIYYCTANYVNNSTTIWKRTAHGAGTW